MYFTFALQSVAVNCQKNLRVWPTSLTLIFSFLTFVLAPDPQRTPAPEEEAFEIKNMAHILGWPALIRVPHKIPSI